MIVLNVLTSVHILFLFFFIFLKPGRLLPNTLLAFVILTPVVNFISNLFILNGLASSAFLIVFYLGLFTSFLFAPLVFAYVEILCGKKIKWKNPLFFITAISMLTIIYLCMHTLLMNDIEQGLFMQNLKDEKFPFNIEVVNIVFILLQQIYFTFSAVRVYRFKKTLPQVLSSTEVTRIKFTQRFIGLIWTLNLITIGLYATLPMYQVEYIALPVVIMVIYSFIIYFGFRYNAIFDFETYNAFKKSNTKVSNFEQLSKAKISDVTSNQDPLVLSIVQHIEETCAFLRNDYSLYDLANELKISTSKVSGEINNNLNESFSDLINRYRVNKAKELLKDKTNYSIEAISVDAGFKSRASFYRSFKKHTKQTPSEFIESN